MSEYTTGEIAKLCGVSVRTVQYYDSRGILIPTKLSEGGRRIYSEDDLKRMKAICFLRELDLPINSIKELMAEEYPEKVIFLLLEEQEKALRTEIEERQTKYNKLEKLKDSLKKVEHLSVESINDAAYVMENRKKLQKVRITMFFMAFVLEVVEFLTFFLGICKGIWQPFIFGMCVFWALEVWIAFFYFKRVSYICPQCHTVFRPGFMEFIWSKHTPYARKLTCTACGHRGFCIETYGKEKKENE